jgi:pimeloyl-ACP methyl ester carboxylesterase
VIVLGADFAAERSFGPEQYAERFARDGYAALAFDYRGFGASDGNDRGLVDPAAQVTDWHAAIDRVRWLDGQRRSIVLWGHGLSGGHVLRVAATSRRVAGVVAVTPLVDGRTLVRAHSPATLARLVAAGVRDRLLARIGRSSFVPVVGGPEEVGALPRTPTGCGYLDLVPPPSDWRNRTPARGVLSTFRYRPLADAADVGCPALLLAGTDDDVAPTTVVAEAADRIDGATFLRLPVGHTDPLDAAADEAAAHQLAFLAGAVGRD